MAGFRIPDNLANSICWIPDRIRISKSTIFTNQVSNLVPRLTYVQSWVMIATPDRNWIRQEFSSQDKFLCFIIFEFGDFGLRASFAIKYEVKLFNNSRDFLKFQTLNTVRYLIRCPLAPVPFSWGIPDILQIIITSRIPDQISVHP